MEVSQNKSGNTEEVLNSSNIVTIKQPANDLVNNINNFPNREKKVRPEKQGTNLRRSQLDSKVCS